MYSLNKTTGCNFLNVATHDGHVKVICFHLIQFCCNHAVAICVVVDVIHVNTCRSLETGGKQCIIWSGVEHHLSPGGCGWMWLDVETWCETDPSHHEPPHLSDSRNKTLSKCPPLLWSILWLHYAGRCSHSPSSLTSILKIMRRVSTGKESNN